MEKESNLVDKWLTLFEELPANALIYIRNYVAKVGSDAPVGAILRSLIEKGLLTPQNDYEYLEQVFREAEVFGIFQTVLFLFFLI